MHPLKAMILRSYLSILLIASLTLLIGTWQQVRYEKMQWFNVSPPPTQKQSALLGLGDTQWSYRLLSVYLQNAGEIAGESKSLSTFDYNRVEAWLNLLTKIDPFSNFSPFLAAFYFSNVKDPEKLRLLIDYLEEVGTQPEPNKWRWLGQAIAIARFDLKDQDLALRLAQELAALDNPDMPAWTRQMPAFILHNKGDKKGAYKIMLQLLQSNADSMPPEEVFFTRDYICTRLLTKQEAKNNKLCLYLKQGKE